MSTLKRPHSGLLWLAPLLALGFVQPAAAQITDPMLRISGTEVVLIRPIEFRSGTAAPTDESEEVLERLRQLLQSTPTIGQIRIDYHADCADAPELDSSLATRRADGLRRWLVNHGVDDDRVETRVIFGPSGDSPIRRRCDLPRSRQVAIFITG